MTKTARTDPIEAGRADGANGSIKVLNPSNGDVVGEVPALTSGLALDAAAAARTAFRGWRATSPIARGAILRAAGALLRENAGELAEIIMRECGKTASEARGEADKSADFFEYYATVGRMPQGEMLDDARPGARAWTVLEPVGVVLAVTPFNDPLITPARKLGPALVAGNTVVLKPASSTPLIALRLAEILAEAGLPPGVLNVITGRGGEVVDPLLNGKLIDAVTFTGSNEVGRQIEQRAAGQNIRVQCELGGKNTAVVMPDADLANAADHLVAAAFAQAGQRCTATSRVLVHADIEEQLVEMLRSRVLELVQGPVDEAGSTAGPMIDPSGLEVAEKVSAEAVAQGANLVTGGSRADGDLAAGNFLRLTVLSQVPKDAQVWTTELFAPVLAVRTFTTFEEALEQVNGTQFGLSAALFSRDTKTIERFCQEAESGQVAINLPTTGWDVHMPFGGFKESGSAFKEQGRVGLGFYQRVKTIAMAP